MKKITCIAVDDEPLALEKIRDYIGRVSFLELKACLDSGVDALNFLKDNHVDLIFLDIQMEDLTGIQMLEALQEKPKVILTTAYDSYAIKGYELDVTDYLLKPISFQRFMKSAERVYKQINQPLPEVKTSVKETGSSEDYFFVKTEYRIQKINFADILFIEGMKDYLRIWTTKEKIMTLLTFNKILEVLPEEDFIRIHKSYIISLPKIESIERSRVRIGGEILPVGESYKQLFNSKIESKKLN